MGRAQRSFSPAGMALFAEHLALADIDEIVHATEPVAQRFFAYERIMSSKPERDHLGERYSLRIRAVTCENSLELLTYLVAPESCSACAFRAALIA